MIVVTQQSDRTKVWFGLAITEPAPDTLSLPAGSCWVHGVEYALPVYAPVVGPGAFRLWVERTGPTMADYVLDLTGEGEPMSFGPGIGALLVAWRDAPGDEIHVLHHEEAA